ncbi:MAG: hypothetical protein PUK67_03625 [Prevotellaceae bacterium]|nr:hypothetical protein [Prevotellaceae bacterium]MDY3365126.1 hypothetical protein [Prevotella sp.]
MNISENYLRRLRITTAQRVLPAIVNQKIWDEGVPRSITPQMAAKSAVAFADALIQELNSRKELNNEDK